MKHAIDLDPETVIELRLPPVEGASEEPPPSLLLRVVPLDLDAEAAGDTAGFIQDVSDFVPRPIVSQSLSSLTRLVIVCDPRPGPPVQLPGSDVQGFMMKESQHKGWKEGDVTNASYKPAGAPFSLALEWLANPAGTWGKHFSDSFDS